MMNGSILIFDRIINNYIKDLRSEKRIGEQEMVDLLAQTGSFLNKFEGTALTQSKGYVVYTYNRAAAKIAKGTMPENEQGFIDKRLDLAISAVMEYLKDKKIITCKNRMLFANRLTAAVHMLTNIASLSNEYKGECLFYELNNSLILWLNTYIDNNGLKESYLRAAETESDFS